MKTGSQLKQRTPLRTKTGFKRPLVPKQPKVRVPLKKKRSRPKRAKSSVPRGIYAAKLLAWTTFARYIRKRDPFCVTCGRPTTEAGHFFHNSDKPNKTLGGNELWYDERNVSGQDTYCNRWKDGNLAQYAIYLEMKHGEGILQDLRAAFVTGKKYTLEDLQQLTLYYEAKYKALLGI